MKTRIVLLGAALVLLLASCFSPLSSDSGTGSITISVPSLEQAGISSSDLSASAAGDGNYFARAFIYRDGSEAGFGEVNVSGSSPSDLTIAGIPEGSGYSLVVTIGTKAAGALFPESYGVNSGGTFSISGGQNTSISVAMKDSPFFYARAGEALKGVAVDSGADGAPAFVTASASTVYAIAPSAIDGSRFVTPSSETTAGFTINGLNQGSTSTDQPVAWAAGLNSIFPFAFNGTGLASPGNIIPDSYLLEGAKNILSSQGYADTIDGQLGAVAMFQIDGGLGGGKVDLSGDPDWGDTGDDLKDFVSGQPVLTINIWERPDGSKTALFATKIGAFAATQEIFEGADQDTITEAFLTGEARPGLIPISLIQGGQSRQITAMSAGSVGGTGRVFLGTARGVFRTNGATIVNDGEISVDAGEAQAVPGTQGLQVVDLEFVQKDNGTSYLAVLTRSRLVVTNLSSGASATIPNVAGVPGIPAVGRSVSGVRGMTLGETPSGILYLALAGDFGFAALEVQELF